GVLVARRRTRGLGVVAAAAAGAAGAAVGTWGGAAWRRLAVGERPDWPGAVAEDAVALTLAAWAVRRCAGRGAGRPPIPVAWAAAADRRRVRSPGRASRW